MRERGFAVLAERRRVLREQTGVAMVTAMVAIFILTVVVAALALATMGETGLSFDQSRSGRAFHLAEAGAYRALAELRRRISADLNTNVLSANPLIVQGHCNSNQGWRIIANYGGTGWVDDAANRRASLAVGTPATPVAVRDAGGDPIGSFYATIYVRPADNGTPPGSNLCGVDPGTGIESYRLRFDDFIVATGVTRNAQRTVCLKNPGNLANCGEWLASANPGSTTYDSAPVAHAWVVLIEAAAYSRRALMLLNSANTWLTDTTVSLSVTFGNGGSPQLIVNDSSAPYDVSNYLIGYTAYGRDMTYDQRFPTNNAPPFFPLTNQYAAARWPRLNPDPLYDRPLWEELTGQ